MTHRVVLMSMMIAAATVRGAPADDGVEAGRNALESTRRLPWYDAETDQIRRIDVKVDRGDDERGTDWETNWTLQRRNRATRWRPQFSFGRFAQGFAIVLFIALIVGLVFILTRTFLRAETARESVLSEDEVRSDVDRVEQLPFQLNRPQSNLFEEARRHYEAGRFGEAMIYLFSYQLVQLDKHQLIRLTKGKTNRQYLREVVKSRPSVRSLLELTMLSFEDVFFGHHPLERKQFEQCWNQLDQFHQVLNEAAQ